MEEGSSKFEASIKQGDIKIYDDFLYLLVGCLNLFIVAFACAPPLVW